MINNSTGTGFKYIYKAYPSSLSIVDIIDLCSSCGVVVVCPSPCYVQINIQIFCEISYLMYGYLIFCMVCLFFKL